MGDRVLITCDYNSANFSRSIQMKSYRMSMAIVVLVLASLACQALAGGPQSIATPSPAADNTGPNATESIPTESAGESSDNTVNTDFPMTPDAYNVTQAAGTLIFYTKMSLEDTMKFYRDEYTSKGYTEREVLTTVSDGIFSMVFDGDPSGKAVVIQSVDLGDGSRTVSIRLEEV